MRPLAILASIPEEPRAISGAGDGHGAAASRTDALGKAFAILKVQLGEMASGTGDLTIAAEARVKEKLLAQGGEALLHRVLVRCIVVLPAIFLHFHLVDERWGRGCGGEHADGGVLPYLAF